MDRRETVAGAGAKEGRQPTWRAAQNRNNQWAQPAPRQEICASGTTAAEKSRMSPFISSAKVVDTIEVMAKDQNSSIRKSAAFEARYVREKPVIPVLIGMIADEERFVALSAVQSLWILTRHETEFHDWETSTKQDRQEWAIEWLEWWNSQKDSFEFSDPKRSMRAR